MWSGAQPRIKARDFVIDKIGITALITVVKNIHSVTHPTQRIECGTTGRAQPLLFLFARHK